MYNIKLNPLAARKMIYPQQFKDIRTLLNRFDP